MVLLPDLEQIDVGLQHLHNGTVYRTVLNTQSVEVNNTIKIRMHMQNTHAWTKIP